MSVRVRVAAIGLVVASLLMVVSCSKFFPGHPARSATPPTTTSTSNASLTERWTSDALTKAFAAINDKIGANPADYVDLLITKYDVEIKAINPQNRQNVDDYTYDGSNVKVAPVDVSHNEPGVIEQSAFKSDTVKPSILATVMNSAVKDSGFQDVTVESVTVKKWNADDPQPHLQAFVMGPRASKAVEYDLATGQFQKVG
jgi:hypothetical protein